MAHREDILWLYASPTSPRTAGGDLCEHWPAFVRTTRESYVDAAAEITNHRPPEIRCSEDPFLPAGQTSAAARATAHCTGTVVRLLGSEGGHRPAELY